MQELFGTVDVLVLHAEEILPALEERASTGAPDQISNAVSGGAGDGSNDDDPREAQFVALEREHAGQQ